MKRSTILVAALAVAVTVLLTGCDWLLGEKVTMDERMSAFVSAANESTRNYDTMRSHWHPDAESYSSMNTEGFWEGTAGFSLGDRTINVSGLTETGDAGVSGTTSLSGTITTANLTSGKPITIGFLPDPSNPRSMLIRVIIIDGGSVDTIKTYR